MIVVAVVAIFLNVSMDGVKQRVQPPRTYAPQKSRVPVEAKSEATKGGFSDLSERKTAMAMERGERLGLNPYLGSMSDLIPVINL